MYKNQLQELAQRSCFNLPWYSCIREGPDHAPRFKATVNFNGEVFESPNFCTTLRQAEHSAAEVALNSLSNKGPPHSLAARILDETGVYKNLLQEVSQRVGAALPQYTTVRSGLGHLPVFTCTVELAGIKFTGEPAKNKKQAEKNAAMAAWSSLKQLVKQQQQHDKTSSSSSSPSSSSSSSSSLSSCSDAAEEQEQVTIARALLNYRLKSIKMAFPHERLASSQQTPTPQYPPPITSSKILPLIRPQKFPGVDAKPYIPLRHFRPPYHHGHGVARSVTIRTAVPVFSAPPIHSLSQPQARGVPVFSAAAPPPPPPVSATTLVRVEEAPVVVVVVGLEEEEPPSTMSIPPPSGAEKLEGNESVGAAPEELPSQVQEGVKELKI